mmetsp:Transcript_3603/g.8867  ORF Transcript_3603/g.8867 Transcript_3603/m.8867 type:complete len:83 (-) Transcript_3603:864-1112(-)
MKLRPENGPLRGQDGNRGSVINWKWDREGRVWNSHIDDNCEFSVFVNFMCLRTTSINLASRATHRCSQKIDQVSSTSSTLSS